MCPAQITAGAPQNAVGPQVAEKPVGAVGRDLGHRAQQSRVAVGGRRVLGGARRLEVLDLNKDTVLVVLIKSTYNSLVVLQELEREPLAIDTKQILNAILHCK